jgi:hypothetical protein
MIHKHTKDGRSWLFVSIKDRQVKLNEDYGVTVNVHFDNFLPDGNYGHVSMPWEMTEEECKELVAAVPVEGNYEDYTGECEMTYGARASLYTLLKHVCFEFDKAVIISILKTELA